MSTNSGTIIYGNSQGDILLGGVGDDIMLGDGSGGGGGPDNLSGDLGNDILIGDGDFSSIVGSAGAGSRADTGGTIWNSTYANLGTLRTSVAGNGVDTLDGGMGSDQLIGGGGNDVFNFEINDASPADIDTVWDFNARGEGDTLQLMVGGVAVDQAKVDAVLTTQTANGNDLQVVFSNGAGKQLTIVAKELGRDLREQDFGFVGSVIYGDDNGSGGFPGYAVVNSGSIASPGMAGGTSNSTLTGGDNNDVIFGDGSGGGGGNDTGSGGAGGLGGGGSDFLIGGPGKDILIGDGFDGMAGIGMFSGPGGGMAGFGGAGGGAYPYYYGGEDRTKGLVWPGLGGQAGKISAGAGAPAGSFPDTNGAGWDTAYTNLASLRTASAGAGKDILDGGAGSDHLVGVGGDDIFVFEINDAGLSDIDTVWDFNARNETDTLQLRDGGVAVDQATINTVLATQTAHGDDRQVVFSNGAGKQVTIIVKDLGRDLVFNDFLSSDKTVNLNEDARYALTAANFGGSLSAVKIMSLPATGSLQYNGAAVIIGQVVSLADLNAGSLSFTPNPNLIGVDYANFTFQAQDSGGAFLATDTMFFNLRAINDAPAGADKAISLYENSAYILASTDFGFSDPNDTPAHNLLAVKIASWSAGSLQLNGVAVTAGQMVSVTDLNAGKLIFTPHGATQATLTFQVQDDGGTSNGGIDLDPSANTMTFNVTLVNDAPAGADKTVTINEDNQYALTAADFGFTDKNDNPNNNLLAIKIATLPTAGTLQFNGAALAVGQFVSVTDLNAGKLLFTPAANANGANQANFTFQVQDDGGTVNGGVDLDPSANQLSFTITAVNDAPVGIDKAIRINENGQYILTTADFGYTDPNDSPANNLLAVKIANLPTEGTLQLHGVAALVGQTLSAIDINSGKLIFIPPANSVGVNSVNFGFQVRDNGGTANGGADLDLTANILTFNINHLPIINSAANGMVAENAAISTVVYTATATDPDAGDTKTYSLGGTDAAAFNIDSVSGVVTLKTAADFETKSIYSINVIDTDTGGLTASKTVTINVTNVNEAPLINSAANGMVAENAAISTVVYTATATDPDAGDTKTYSLGGTDAAAFNIDSVSGVVTLKTAADFETKSIYSINVIDTDTGGLTASKTVTINVTNVNEAPLINSAANGMVAENAAISTVVYTATATDPDAGDTKTYSLGGTDAAAFNIDSVSGVVTLKTATDFETKSIYSINVIDTDTGGLTASKTVTINVTNVNEAPLINSAANGTVAENAAISTVVYTATATDPDAGDTKTYSLGGTDAAAFNIDRVSGVVTLKTATDFETKSSYSINVIDTDKGGLTASKTVTINVTDVNEAPTAVTLINSSGSLVENLATMQPVKVAKINVTDDALGTNTLSLTGADADSFQIIGTALYLKAGVELNYEAKTSYAVTVQVLDKSLEMSPVSAAYKLSITNGNDAPVITSGLAGSVTENAAPGAVVYDVDASDEDSGSTLTYLLFGGSSQLFAINSTTGVVTLKASANYETRANYSLNVMASDGLNSVKQVVNISVTDVNEAPNAIKLDGQLLSKTSAKINENSMLGTIVGTLQSSDIDGDTLTYQLTSGNSDLDGDGQGAFALNAATGVLSVNDQDDLNFELQKSFALGVEVSDGSLKNVGTATIKIQDVIDTPGVTITALGAATTSELGGTAQFTIVLNTQPLSNVNIIFTSSNKQEGNFATTNFTFTHDNWNLAQILTIQGVDDAPNDIYEATGTAYQVQGTITSSDINYMRGITVPTLNLTNQDDPLDQPIAWTGDNTRNDKHGGNGNDILSGEGEIDFIYGGRGDDRLNGGNDNDKLYGEDGNDGLNGDNNDDQLNGGAGNDILNGGNDDDSLMGGDGDDQLNGDNGLDSLNGSAGQDSLNGGEQNDTLDGGDGNDKLYGQGGDDNLLGGAGLDTLDGGVGADTMDGGIGNDVYYLDDPADTVKDSGPVTDLDTLIIPATLTYTLGASLENATLNGSGNGKLIGNIGRNMLTGNSGNNVLDGSAGNDTLIGGAGNDTLKGGTGVDTASYAGVKTSVNANLTTGKVTGEGTDILSTIENILSGAGSDILTGNSSANNLNGGAGNDIISGGAGRDTLIGSTGADKFTYQQLTDSGIGSAACDVINDFFRVQGDKIDLHLIGAKSFIAGDFSGSAGQVRFDSVNHLLQLDTNGDARGDLEIELTGVTQISTADLILLS